SSAPTATAASRLFNTGIETAVGAGSITANRVGRKAILFALFLPVAVAFTLPPHPAHAQQQSVIPLPSNTEELDAFLMAHDWNRLAAALSRDDRAKDLQKNLNWLR